MAGIHSVVGSRW